MNWFAIATIAYFLIALEVILDKFLLSSKRVSHPVIYAFYSGVLSLFAIALFPFGIHSIAFFDFLKYLLAGAIFTYGFLSLFFAIQKGEASRVTVVVGASIPVFTYILSYFFLEDQLTWLQIGGVVLLIFGGLLISWEFSKTEKRNFFSGFWPAILAGAVLALSYTLTKRFYEQDNFLNVFVWTRIGVTVGALSLLLFAPWRKVIFFSLSKFKKSTHYHQSSGMLFVLNKILGGVGSILLNRAISLGSVTVINALISLEYAFVFIMGIFSSLWLPHVFKEKRDWKNTLQKISAIILITIGIIIVAKF